MKRKYINKVSWSRILEGKSILINDFTARFEGYAAAIFIEKAHQPLMCEIENHKIPLCADGYTWIQRLPLSKNYAISTMFDENDNIIQWYIDITKLNSIDIYNEPFYDDLYLDVVIFPNGDTFLLDEDELQEALDCGKITKTDFDLAYLEANKILNGIARDLSKLSKISLDDFNFFKSIL